AYSSIVPKNQENDIVLKIVDWVESQKAPDSFIATKYADAKGTSVALERPICTYPKIPKYQGGDSTKAGNFLCADASRGNVPPVSLRYFN
ncbi:MAG: tannase/feruloyl esterase family alpha/beta hydrolase, partial [Cytophagaceae bacterium]